MPSLWDHLQKEDPPPRTPHSREPSLDADAIFVIVTPKTDNTTLGGKEDNLMISTLTMDDSFLQDNDDDDDDMPSMPDLDNSRVPLRWLDDVAHDQPLRLPQRRSY